jgi:hypothetical protein
LAVAVVVTVLVAAKTGRGWKNQKDDGKEPTL